MTIEGRPFEPVDARIVLRFGVAAIAAIVVFWAIYAVFVLTEAGQRLENLGLEGAALRADAERADSLASLSQISVFSYGVAIAIVLAAAILQRRPWLGALVLVVMVGSTGLAEILKAVLPRPELISGPSWLLRNTFPSGHATVAASIGVGAILVTPSHLRWLVVPAAAIYASLIGQATQVAGWHRMSGAIGGVVLVLAVAASALGVLANSRLVRPSGTARPHPRVRMAMALAAAGVLLVGGLVVVLPIAFPLLQAPRGASGAFVHTALDLFGVGTSLLAMLAFGALVEAFSIGRAEGPGLAARDGVPHPG